MRAPMIEPSVEAGQEFRRKLAERVAAQRAERSPREAAEKRDRKQIMLTAIAGVLLVLLTSIAGFAYVSASDDDLVRRLGVAGAITAILYAVVALLTSRQLTTSIFRPRLTEGSARRSVLLGLGWGGGAALLLGVLISLAVGRPTSDDRIIGVMFEGNAFYVFVTVFLAVIAAPFIEEVLFRGLVLESLRPKGRTSALLGSAVLFSVWHVNPTAARYYVLMGFIFGVLYWRFGLAGTISAHFAFNGVLTVFAFLALATPSTITSEAGVSVELPGGWYEVSAEEVGPMVDVAAESAVGSRFIVDHIDSPTGAVDLPLPDEVPPAYTNPRLVSVAGAQSLRFETEVEGEDAYVVLVPRGSKGYTVSLMPGGSDRAVEQFEEILQTISLP